MAVNSKQIRENRCPDCAGRGTNSDHEDCATCHGTGFLPPAESGTADNRERFIRHITDARACLDDARNALSGARQLRVGYEVEIADACRCLDALAERFDNASLDIARLMRMGR